MSLLLRLAMFFSLCLPLFASSVIYNENMLSQKVVLELDKIGAELYKKTNIKLLVSIANQTSFEEALKKADLIKEPYILLVLSKSSHKLDIRVKPAKVLELFDKEAVLSPFSNEGTILPLLASNKGKDIYNAAILNGYADIAERVAKSKDIKLQSSIGDANRSTLDVLRFIIYGTVLLALLVIITRKIKKAKIRKKNA